MCLRQTAALVGLVGLTTLQKEAVTVCYITQGMIEKLYRVLVDAGDMISLQRAWATQQHVECKIHSTRKRMTKSVANAFVTNEVSIDLHPHDYAFLCCATYIVVLF